MTIKKMRYKNICIFVDEECKKEYDYAHDLIQIEIYKDKQNNLYYDFSIVDSTLEEYKSVMYNK